MQSDALYGMKTCTQCEMRLPLSAFPARGGANRKPHSWCKKCRSLYNAAHQKYVPNGRPRGVPKGYIRKAKP